MYTLQKAKAKKRSPLVASAHEIRVRSRPPSQKGYFTSTQLSQKSAAFAKVVSAKGHGAIMALKQKHLEEARAHF
jgi:hypothetical protein